MSTVFTVIAVVCALVSRIGAGLAIAAIVKVVRDDRRAEHEEADHPTDATPDGQPRLDQDPDAARPATPQRGQS